MRYKKFVLFVILTVIFSAAIFAQDEKPIRVETNLVNVNVAVRNEKGDFVENLKKEQFDVFDNNRKQQIEYFSAEDAPVSFGIVYDLHPTTDERTITVLESLRQFTKELRPTDDFFVTVFNERGSLTLDFVPTAEQVKTNLSGKFGSPNSLYDAIYAAGDKIRNSKNLKRTLLIITDSADHRSKHSFSELESEFKTLDVQIYAVIWDEAQQFSYSDIIRDGRRRSSISRDATTSLDRVAMLGLTLRNNGTSQTPTIQNAQELYRIFSQIGFEMRKQYTLGFYPEAIDGKEHQLKIVFRPAARKIKGLV
ncbi:MAG: VWA domain-containing protein, partial [Acidobacteriota bacterium]